MTSAWLVIILTGAFTVAIKGIGPLLLGGRPLPLHVNAVVSLLAPALLAALVAINTFADGSHLTIDARVAGVAAAGVAVWRKAPVLVVVIVAAVVTAAVRALAG